MNKTVYIFGHKNPDTDSAVSATAYARLKQLLGFNNYVAARAGHLSPQTEYIYNRFKIKSPEYISELNPKVSFYMETNVQTVNENDSLWASLSKMEKAPGRVLPVVDKNGCYKSFLHYSAFAQNMLVLMNPEKAASISTSVKLMLDTMNAQPIVLHNQEDIFKATVLIGSATLEEFNKILDEHKSENIIVITGNRREIHEACINSKIKLLVITNGYVLDKDLKEKAKQNGVSVIISPFPTSNTTMLAAYSTPVIALADSSIEPFHPKDLVSKVLPKLKSVASRRIPVVDQNNKVKGIIAESDFLHEANVELILVDHNEMSQCVEGFENYRIQEVIDHHRLGTLSTKYPIMFINKPVGATATLIANLYREYKISIPKDIASLLLCGIISDTLILKSTTTTELDKETAEYLSAITDLDIEQLGQDIISAGSKIGGRKASEVIKQDMKEYTEGKIVYTISQIEVDNPQEILSRKEEFLSELEIERRSRKGLFACLLVTDITKLSSMLFVASDKDFQSYINFPKMEENIFYLKDIVSRKKQLVPLVSEQIAKISN
ncbi:MAG: putative manganese-dependent inorganic diphosphatase [Treponema sp.]|nr:putative manganese-dependent inorganic diphosphatase [Treponema sp.]